MSLAEKFLAGADLFEEACRWTMMGIRNQFPDFNVEEQRAELRRRLEMISIKSITGVASMKPSLCSKKLARKLTDAD